MNADLNEEKPVAHRSIMTLGQLIDTLSRKPEDEEVYFDFAYFRPTTLRSYRGRYEQLALGYTDEAPAPTVGKLLSELRSAVGKTFTGYKGGDFVMTERTPVWVANPGEAGGTAIVDVVEHTYITLVTEQLD